VKKALKVELFFLTILLAFTLIGCSSVKSYLGKQMMKQSSVLEDANYKSFEQYRIEGKLDPDGYYQYEDETTGASLGTVQSHLRPTTILKYIIMQIPHIELQ
jgi:hypothetical protein